MDTAFIYFETVVELGSIRQAAEKLHISASSISRQIQKLEHFYGTALLLRQAQGVRLTPAGELAVRYVKNRAKELQRLRSSIDSLKNLESGHVVIYTVEGMIGGLLPRALATFGEKHPGITYEVCTASTDDVMQAVADYRCDIGISFQPYPRPEVERLSSFRQPLNIVVSATHPFARLKQIRMSDIGDLPVGLPDRFFGIRHLVDHAVKADLLTLNVRLETNSIDMLRQFALQSMGLVFLPAFSFERELLSGELVGIPIISRALSLSTAQICKRAEVELTPSANKLAKVIIETAEAFSHVA